MRQFEGCAMTNQETRRRLRSAREQEHAAMLKEALARPGVREFMDVYCKWQEKNRGLDAYRSATEVPERTTTSNSSNAL